MSLGIGGIVSLGGGTGGSGGGSGSGIQSVNSQIGPAIAITGVNGINVTASANVITIDGAGASGTVGSASSQSGVIGVNGITVDQIGGNFVVNGAALSGLISGGVVSLVASYSATFTNVTSGIFDHNLGTHETIVQVYDDSLPPRVIFPDEVISENLNQIGVIFNRPQTGRVVIHAPSGISLSSGGGSSVSLVGVSGVRVIPSGANSFIISGENISVTSSSSPSNTNCYSQDFTNVSSVTGIHNFGTLNVLTQVFDTNGRVLLPDSIHVSDINTVVVSFNTSRSGKVVVHGCSAPSSSGVSKFSQSFTSVSSINVSHFMSTQDVIVQVRDNNSPPGVILPDSILVLDINTVNVRFNSIRSGRITIMG